MDFVHDRSRSSQEGRHLAVSGVVQLSVVRLADYKEGPLVSWAIPTSPRLVMLAESKFKAKARHDRLIQAERAIEIRNADEDMGKHELILNPCEVLASHCFYQKSYDLKMLTRRISEAFRPPRSSLAGSKSVIAHKRLW